jgi:signal transduction histidine kinase
MNSANASFSTQMLAATLDALPDPAFILSRSGRYVAVFGGTDKRYYHDGSGLVGLSIGDVLAPEKTLWFLAQIETVLQTRQLLVVEYALSGSDVKILNDEGPSEAIWFEGRVQALNYQVDGEEVVLWVASNITASHQLRLDLAQALLREQDSSFQQRQFIGVVSHEFRTPLAIIDSVLTNLRLVAPTQAVDLAQRVSTIEAANNQLILLTDTCLADARLGAGLEVDERLPIDLCALLRHSGEIVDPLKSADWLRFQCNQAHQRCLPCKHAQRCIITGSSGLLRIALTNLLDNARKYAPTSAVDVTVWRDASNLHLCLRDHGSGIDAADHQAIFERFRRGANVGHKKGNGLGLYVSREIVRGHGGELRLLSSNEQGSTFEICLPNT